jgi:hypothetical protein
MDLQISALSMVASSYHFTLDPSRESLFCGRRALPPATPELLHSARGPTPMPGQLPDRGRARESARKDSDRLREQPFEKLATCLV